jgi:cytochrome c oxidase subunit III
MNVDTAVLRTSAGKAGDDIPGATTAAVRGRGRPPSIHGVALWLFIGVATTLFSLFIVAYVMRMANADAVAIAMPPQLLASTALLVLGSALLHRAGTAASRARDAALAWRWLLAGGACAFVFLAAQGSAWQALLARQVTAAGNPAGSFFYLLTAMHALHVAGGLIAWTVVARAFHRERTHDPAAAAWRVGLLARYWHFLLLAWLALFACFSGITPEVARIICGAP